MVTNRLAVFPLLLFLLTSTGCLAVAAGAAGGELANRDEDAIQRYMDTRDVEYRIAKAIYDRKIVKGMTKEQVSFLLGLREVQYVCEAGEVQEDTSEWICEDTDPMHVGQYVIQFREGKVVKSEIL